MCYGRGWPTVVHYGQDTRTVHPVPRNTVAHAGRVAPTRRDDYANVNSQQRRVFVDADSSDASVSRSVPEHAGDERYSDKLRPPLPRSGLGQVQRSSEQQRRPVSVRRCCGMGYPRERRPADIDTLAKPCITLPRAPVQAVRPPLSNTSRTATPVHTARKEDAGAGGDRAGERSRIGARCLELVADTQVSVL
jgi:hypothetical protein